MPSPFPGMDPYLEDPATWPNLHANLIIEIQGVLNDQIRPKYYARVGERIYVSDQDDPGRRAIVPDVRILSRSGPQEVSTSDQTLSDVAVAQPVTCTTLIEDEIREVRLEVIDHASREVVAVIEVVSPTNKIAGARGQYSYRAKRTAVMNSSSHWIEIDLLRHGETLVAGELLPRGDYFVHVSRVESRPQGQVWPIQLTQRLPVIPIPLRGDDSDAKLDLQEILSTVYERSGYELDVDYTTEPMPPLTPTQASWADQLLREKGYRS